MRADEPRRYDEMQQQQPRREEEQQQMDREQMRREEMRREDPVNRSPVMDNRDDDRAWPEMANYRRRFEELQSQFIEEPKEAVKKAESLVEEAVEKMVSSLHDRVNHIHSELGDGTDDTERLRMAMRRYRQLIDSFAENRAA